MSASKYAFRLVSKNPWILFVTAGICILLFFIALAAVLYYGLVTAIMLLGISSLALALLHKLHVIDLGKQPFWFIVPVALALIGYASERLNVFSINPYMLSTSPTSYLAIPQVSLGIGIIVGALIVAGLGLLLKQRR